MYVLEVVPLSRTAPLGTLTYRSKEKVAVGTLLSVPLRRQTVPGLVVECIPVQEAKAMVKAAPFQLSRSGTVELGRLPDSLLTATEEIAAYHATTLGSVLASLLVPVLDAGTTIEKISSKVIKTNADSFSANYVELPYLERIAAYEKILEKNKGDSVLLIAPTIIEVQGLMKFFSKYSPIILTSTLTPKQREKALGAISAPIDSNSIQSNSDRVASARLIIATPSFIALPLLHLSHLIVERVSAGSYVEPKRPYIDVRVAATEIARARKIEITYGDFPLPIEYRKNPRKPLAISTAGAENTEQTPIERSVQIFDARIDKEAGEKWHAVPNALRVQIQKVLDTKGRVAVLAVRKGYAPTVICRDCGTAVTDEYGRVLSLHIRGKERTLRSADGKTIQSAKMLCKTCGSWNLMPLGIGVEQVEEELHAAFPEARVVRLPDSISSQKARKKILEDLQEPGTISIGTESLLPWLSPETPVDLAIIASADSLLSLPFWRARERFVRVGLLFAERSKKLIIATRKPEDNVFTAVTAPSTSTFWEEETDLRKLLSYPPFGTLLIFQMEGSQQTITNAKKLLDEACTPRMLIHLEERGIGKSALRAVSVLHLPENAWPDAALTRKVGRLPPSIRIQINAETLW